MTLIFGKLTQSFVKFGTIVNFLLQNPGDPALLVQLADAQRELKSQAARDSLYLVIIGIAMFVATYLFMSIFVLTGERESILPPTCSRNAQLHWC